MKSSLLITLWVALCLVACTGQATPTLYLPAEQETPPRDRTPTASDPTIDSDLVVEPPPPTPTPDCKSYLAFIEDVTIPDGTQVQPQVNLDKRWLVENRGTCNWDRRFSLRLIAGSEMGASPNLSLYPARSGRQAEIQIQFTAPQEPGIHRSAWQAADPQGNFFGDTIFIEIEVVSP